LLFVFGIGLHILWDVPGRAGKWMFGGLLLAVLGTDALIAHFVENKIHEMKILMGLANETDPHSWWASPIFWLVMAMGFVAALAWSLLLHAWMHENGKKDVARLTALDITHRRDKQIPYKVRLNDLKAQLAQLEGDITRIDLDIKALQESRQAVSFSPAELEKYVTDFYDGWLTYVNNRMGNDVQLRAECDAVMKAFYAQHLSGNRAATAVPVSDTNATVVVDRSPSVGLTLTLGLGLLAATLLTPTATVLAHAGLSAGADPKPTNYVVLLDLSDRLLVSGQAERDLALVQAVFARFETTVRQQQLVFSKDCFRVVIAPQKGVNYRPEAFMDALYLDMATLPMADKRKRLDALRTDLPRQLASLYAKALAGKRQPRDFAGCDLWQYANEQLPTDLNPRADNVLVVLTDGYLDFEQNTHGLTQGNRATDSRMLDRLRRDPYWRQTLSRPTEGILPVQKPLPNLRVCVAEVRPKYDNLHETDLLTTLWDKWLRECRAVRWAVQVRGSQPKSLAMLREFLSN
jgi:hypothetical protein